MAAPVVLEIEPPFPGGAGEVFRVIERETSLQVAPDIGEVIRDIANERLGGVVDRQRVECTSCRTEKAWLQIVNALDSSLRVEFPERRRRRQLPVSSGAIARRSCRSNSLAVRASDPESPGSASHHAQYRRAASAKFCKASDTKPARYVTFIPGSAPLSGDSRNTSGPSSPLAHNTMPCETPKRILRGSRLAIMTTWRPMSVAGS